MCGIAGQVRVDGDRVDRSLVERMCRAIEHRGPDSRGVHCEGPAGLGIQRLRVIDLDTGDQPIYNEDRSVAVVLNGEIYNYAELRDGLLERGHRLETKGDTEVIVHLYEELGSACVEELDGMFAFALWDDARKRLLIGRDRLGKKPLYYAADGNRLSFGSEFGALLQDRSVSREINETSIDGFFAYKYVPPPNTAFRAVRSLPPAHTLVYEGGKVTTERYWRLLYDGPQADGDEAEINERVREELRAAVGRRLVSDVPLGAFLSGGIDSAAVVAAMSEQTSRAVKTFSIGFEGSDETELPLARVTAERFGTDHSEVIVKPDAVSVLPQLVRHYGEPFADTSALPSFYVAQAARSEVTVALNGDGGDESFAGYEHYLAALRTSRAAELPKPVRRVIAAAGRFAPERENTAHPLSRAARLSNYILREPAGRYAEAVSVFTTRQRERLYTKGFAGRIDEAAAPAFIERPWSAATATDPVNKMLEVDIATYLPGDLLVKMDIASMANSLEARSPFLDHRLMEFAATIPGDAKLAGGQKKLVLRRALRGWIPDEILDAPKRGFGLDTAAEWFRSDLEETLRDSVSESVARKRGYFEAREVGRLVDSHISGRADNSSKLWALMMFELWHREFIDSAPTP